MIKLKPKHEEFCQQFMIDRKEAKAYIRAGYSATNAETSGPRLFRKVQIRARIDELTAELAERNKLSVDKILKLWGEVIDGETENTANKLIAGRDAAKHLGMFKDKETTPAEINQTIYYLEDIRPHKKD